jgi:hypothetical protein
MAAERQLSWFSRAARVKHAYEEGFGAGLVDICGSRSESISGCGELTVGKLQ